MKAVVDRFENGYAVVLLGDEEIELTVARSSSRKRREKAVGLKSALNLTGKKQKNRRRGSGSYWENYRRKTPG